ncbi:MAG: hypothetical protein R8N24_01125 [Alphaproteobacteria bacterium]|nr:hypothetical protein [Alphaproteobacteria bacterium]
MFTQQNKINVSRCNGCPKRCLLGARAVILYDNIVAYRPTIQSPYGHIKVHHSRKVKRRLSQTYNKASVALSHARTAAHDCFNFTPPPEQEHTSNIKTHCQGCDKQCELAAVKINTYKQEDIYAPKIGDKTIKLYFNKRGLTKTVPSFKTALPAFIRANKISKLCDNYNYNQTR